MPPITFEPVSLPNRVLTKTNTTNNWQRLANIRTETGEQIQITYSEPQCTASNLPAAPESNTKLCYPVIGPDPRDVLHQKVCRRESDRNRSRRQGPDVVGKRNNESRLRHGDLGEAAPGRVSRDPLPST